MIRNIERVWSAWLWLGAATLLGIGLVLVRVNGALDAEMSNMLANERVHIEKVAALRRGARTTHVSVLERWVDPLSERNALQSTIETGVRTVRADLDAFVALPALSASEDEARGKLAVAIAIWSNRINQALVAADGPAAVRELRACLDAIDQTSDAVLAILSTAGSSSDEKVVVLHRTQGLIEGAFVAVVIAILAVAVVGWRRFVASDRARIQNERSAELRTRFFANLSHELRTPLIAIRGFACTIEENASADAEVRDSALRIGREAHDLLDAINNILDAAKLEAGKVELRVENVRLSPIVARCIQRCQGLIGSKPIELRVEVSETLPLVRADVVKLQQVLTNLLANAIKFTDQGTVLLSARDISNGRIEIAVEDTGIGIREDAIDRVWKPFEQAFDHDGRSAARRFAGTGLGLSIVRSIVELLGGEVRLTSKHGHGTRVFVVLPSAGVGVPSSTGPVAVRREGHA